LIVDLPGSIHRDTPLLFSGHTPEIIIAQAFMPHDGCRKVAETFNCLYEDKRMMSVGKTYVYNTLKRHQYEIQVVRRKIKSRKPRTLPKNLIWSMDLTQVTDANHQTHTLLGVVDSGTRACLQLQQVPTKASIALLRLLLETIENCGKPKAVRTDNEAVFTSRLFRFGLWLLNIKHQRTEKCCPWMNGKIERFFGMLNERLGHYTINSIDSLADHLHRFRF
jgi:putative transposase